jgi:hypothetical protein
MTDNTHEVTPDTKEPTHNDIVVKLASRRLEYEATRYWSLNDIGEAHSRLLAADAEAEGRGAGRRRGRGEHIPLGGALLGGAADGGEFNGAVALVPPPPPRPFDLNNLPLPPNFPAAGPTLMNAQEFLLSKNRILTQYEENILVNLKTYESSLIKTQNDEKKYCEEKMRNYNRDCLKVTKILLESYSESICIRIINDLAINRKYREIIRNLNNAFGFRPDDTDLVTDFMSLLSNLTYNERDFGDFSLFMDLFMNLCEILNSTPHVVLNEINKYTYLKSAIIKGNNQFSNIMQNFEWNNPNKTFLALSTALSEEDIRIKSKNESSQLNSMYNSPTDNNYRFKNYKTNNNNHDNKRFKSSGDSTHESTRQERIAASQTNNNNNKKQCNKCNKSNHTSDNCWLNIKCPTCSKYGCAPWKCFSKSKDNDLINSSQTSNNTSKSKGSNSKILNKPNNNISLAEQFKIAHKRPITEVPDGNSSKE